MNKYTEYAAISWTIDDIKTIKPEWTPEECNSFLFDNEDAIRESATQSGWETIEFLLTGWYSTARCIYDHDHKAEPDKCILHN